MSAAPSLEQRARRAPLPCYGLEFNKDDLRCQQCPHHVPCTKVMGTRLNRVPLSKVRFRLVPVTYNLIYDDVDFDDPEIANMPRTYAECYETVYRKAPPDSLRFRDEIAAAARRNECSIRLYMLTVMIAHRANEHDIVRLSERGVLLPFKSKMFLGKVAQRRFETFRDLCSKEYGTFSLSRISTLLDYNFDKNSPEQHLLNSEIKAGQCIVDFKMMTGGPFYEHLYDQCELSLDPLWLAVEHSYKTYVLDPYREKPRGSAVQKDHRHAVSLSIQFLKSHRHSAIMAFQAREAVMPKAINDVLRIFGYGADDLLIADEPVTDPLSFWNWIALALQHDECLRYADGERTRISRSSRR